MPVWIDHGGLATLRWLPGRGLADRIAGNVIVVLVSRNFEEAIVASHCDVCGKGPGFGMSVSHSHRRTHRRWNQNVQTVRALVAPGTRRRVTVCTSCLKAGKVTRA
jgi:large subunit ribosomal protein L28